MKITLPKLAVSLAAGLFAASIITGQTTAGKQGLKITEIVVDASKPAEYTIPRTIYGSFLEPIENSTYGGLVAEILDNPSFEEGLWDATHIKTLLEEQPYLVRASELSLPLPWEPLDVAQGNRYEPRWNDAANSYRSMFIMGLPDQEVGIRQKVYLPVHRTALYRGSFYAKYVSGAPEVGISLRERNKSDKVFVRKTIQVTSTDWARYEFTLELPKASIEPLEPADFVITVGPEGRILLDEVSLLPADNIAGMDPEVISMAKAMKSPMTRFGGNFTSGYHWRDGIGPLEKRVSMKNVAWGIPEYNTFGTDEFLRFCKLVGSRPQIALNLGSGTPEEDAAWVKYVNEQWDDHSGGLLWEMGNELWGTFQVGYPTMQRVAQRTNTFALAVHLVDPQAVLIGTGADEDFYHDWNAEQLSVANSINYLSTHFVVRADDVVKKDPSLDFIAAANFALPIGLERKLREMYSQIQSVPGARNRVKLAFTEWLFGGQPEKGPRFDNMGGAIETAGFLNMLMRVADFVPISDMTGTMYFGGIWKQRGRVFGVPAYWAFRMYSNADAIRTIETITDSETYDVEQGSTRLPTISHVPYLDVVATLNASGDKMTLFCVNRHLTRDIPTNISVRAFTPSPQATVQSLYANSIFEKNDETRPEAVHPLDSSITTSNSRLNFTFRHESLTVLTLNRAN